MSQHLVLSIICCWWAKFNEFLFQRYAIKTEHYKLNWHQNFAVFLHQFNEIEEKFYFFKHQFNEIEEILIDIFNLYCSFIIHCIMVWCMVIYIFFSTKRTLRVLQIKFINTSMLMLHSFVKKRGKFKWLLFYFIFGHFLRLFHFDHFKVVFYTVSQLFFLSLKLIIIYFDHCLNNIW